MCPEDAQSFSPDSSKKDNVKALDAAVKERFPDLESFARIEVENHIKKAITIIQGEDFRNPPSVETLLEHLEELGVTRDVAESLARKTKSLFDVFGRFSDQELENMAGHSDDISLLGVTQEMKKGFWVSDVFMDNLLQADIGLGEIFEENKRKNLEKAKMSSGKPYSFGRNDR